MKLIKILIIVCLFIPNLLLGVTNSQITRDTLSSNIRNKKLNKSISVGVILPHFYPTRNAKMLNFTGVLFNFGIESLYNLKLKSNLTVSSGIQYQRGKIQRSHYPERVSFEELSIPLLFTLPLTKNYRFSISSGLYIGQYLSANIETKGNKLNSSNDWNKIPNEYIENYSTNDNITDLYLGIGYRDRKIVNSSLNVKSYLKFRMKTHWTNQRISRWIIGINLNYTFKL